MIRGEFPAILIGTALLLGACQSVPTPQPLAPEELGALAPAAVPELRPGASFTFRKNDGAEITSRVVAVDGSDTVWEADNGWSWTAKTFYWPVERWQGASSQGAQEVIGDPDALFPLAVGRRAAYRYQGRSTADPRGWSGRGRCSVAAAERITVPAGTPSRRFSRPGTARSTTSSSSSATARARCSSMRDRLVGALAGAGCQKLSPDPA